MALGIKTAWWQGWGVGGDGAAAGLELQWRMTALTVGRQPQARGAGQLGEGGEGEASRNNRRGQGLRKPTELATKSPFVVRLGRTTGK